jgi:hypothetical protein
MKGNLGFDFFVDDTVPPASLDDRHCGFITG